ncbi:hypothetical protein EDD22DRAFT_853448 [Suillus occidentalis]|nr:hypothetical protein EDD22DRAFT_853448 [Suillus occidentalis]
MIMIVVFSQRMQILYPSWSSVTIIAAGETTTAGARRLGTFQQRYCNDELGVYEPGGPIIWMMPGEGNADGRFHYNRFVASLSKDSISGYDSEGYTTVTNDSI